MTPASRIGVESGDGFKTCLGDLVNLCSGVGGHGGEIPRIPRFLAQTAEAWMTSCRGAAGSGAILRVNTQSAWDGLSLRIMRGESSNSRESESSKIPVAWR